MNSSIPAVDTLSVVSAYFLNQLFPYNTVLSIPAIILNSFVIKYYIHQYKRFVPSLYLIIASCDILMTLSFLVQSILLKLHYGREESNENAWSLGMGIYASSGIYRIFYRVSVFANLILSVSRTIQIMHPFYRMRRRLVYVAIITWLTISSLTFATELFLMLFKVPDDDKDFAIKAIIAATGLCPLLGSVIITSELGAQAMLGVAFGLPTIIVLGCMMVQIYWIRKPSAITASCAKQNHVTVTILMLTLLFFICNAASNFLYVTATLYNNVDAYLMFGIIVSSFYTLPLLNAACSPAILICRSAAMRVGVLALFRCQKDPKPGVYSDRSWSTRNTAVLEVETRA